MKILKFREHLVPLILSGEKNVTWRLFDDKDISVGDVVDFINWNTGEKFGESEVLLVSEKKFGELEEDDFQGHERFLNSEEKLATYNKYYDNKVTPDTIIKMITFDFKKN
jgi:hypothetical protein